MSMRLAQQITTAHCYKHSTNNQPSKQHNESIDKHSALDEIGGIIFGLYVARIVVVTEAFTFLDASFGYQEHDYAAFVDYAHGFYVCFSFVDYSVDESCHVCEFLRPDDQSFMGIDSSKQLH